MKKSGLIFFVVFLFFAIGLLAQDSSKLKGEWLCSTEYGQVGLSFINNNTLVYDGEQLNYSIQQNYIVINSDGQVIYYPYTFQKGNLLITYPDGYTLLFKQTSKTTKNINSNTNQAGNSTSGNTFLMGKLCEYGSSSSYSTYSSYSHLNWLYFDGNGNFQFGGEQSYGGESEQAYGNSGIERGTYQISNNQVHFQFSNGKTYSMRINMVQNSGRITELFYGEKLYAAGLCE